MKTKAILRTSLAPQLINAERGRIASALMAAGYSLPHIALILRQSKEEIRHLLARHARRLREPNQPFSGRYLHP
jgi:hypothetical protein